eukprot:gb/GFBE01021146.1/.p1 GENE.gb/GFBE01021146.1/~~gb/GFBE01021146.1/.p1  ORF type:complete len:238 (+),score=40.52 gb/GFBE01021146.1/:1-714(+)
MIDLDEDADECLPANSMLERPIFVCWCNSCGAEAASEAQQCLLCGGQVQRHQRVLELDDEDEGPFSLRNLREALADLSLGTDVGSSAVLLSEQGQDPGVAAAYPELASELANLGVPPAVQRTLVSRGFVSLEQILSAVASAPDSDTLTSRLGLSPAAEVLVRRFWQVASDTSKSSFKMSSASPMEEGMDQDFASEVASKRPRTPLGTPLRSRFGSPTEETDFADCGVVPMEGDAESS